MLTALLLASQRIPLVIDPMDRLSVNGTISSNVTGEQRIVPLRLSPSRHHSISFIGRLNFSHPILSVGPVDNIPAVTDDLSSSHAFLSISQSSHLTTVSESVSVIRNGISSEIFMELGLSTESFQQQYCASTIELSNSSPVVLSSSLGSSEYAGVTLTFDHDRPGSMIYLPRFLGERINTVLSNNGARELGISRFFSNCVLATLDGLPDIHIQIGNDTLLLAPDDYIGIIEGSQACFAKFSMLQDYPPARLLGINPLVIKGINTRISADSVTICDTSL